MKNPVLVLQGSWFASIAIILTTAGLALVIISEGVYALRFIKEQGAKLRSKLVIGRNALIEVGLLCTGIERLRCLAGYIGL